MVYLRIKDERVKVRKYRCGFPKIDGGNDDVLEHAQVVTGTMLEMVGDRQRGCERADFVILQRRSRRQ